MSERPFDSRNWYIEAAERWLAERGIPADEFARAGGSINGARLVLPFRHRDGTLVERYLCADKLNSHWHNPLGSKVKGAVLLFGDLDRASRVLITEGPSDTIRAGMHLAELDDWAVVGIPAAGQVPDDLAAWVGGREIVIATDGDAAGDKAAQEIAAKLNGSVVRRFRPDEGTDLRDLADKMGPGRFSVTLRQAPTIGVPKSGSANTRSDLPPAFARFVGELLTRGLNPREISPGMWSALCPAHDDHTPSLSLRVGDEVPVAIFCHAGCEPAAIARAVGMTLRDLTAQHDDEPGSGIVQLDEVEERDVEWLAYGLIPKGALTQIVGRGGVGKSTFAIHVAARVTRGEPVFPHLPRPSESGSVLIVSAEDSIAHVLVARCRIAGADLARVHVIDLAAVDFVLPDSLGLIEAAVEEHGITVVILDPLSAFLGGRVDSHKDASLRGVLRPLHALAEKYHLSILGILHVNQANSGDIATKTAGSGAWINAARSALAFGRAPETDDTDPRRIVALAKSNYGPLGVAYELRLVIPDGEVHPVVEPGGPSNVSAQTLLTESTEQVAPSEVDRAVELLLSVLADGECLAKDVEAEAGAQDPPISNITFRRARKQLGVVSRREGFGKQGLWYLSLPPGVPPPSGTRLKSAYGVAGQDEPLCANPVVEPDSDDQAPIGAPKASHVQKKSAYGTGAPDA